MLPLLGNVLLATELHAGPPFAKSLFHVNFVGFYTTFSINRVGGTSDRPKFLKKKIVWSHILLSLDGLTQYSESARQTPELAGQQNLSPIIVIAIWLDVGKLLKNNLMYIQHQD